MLHPNPTSGKSTISLNSTEQHVELELTSASGKLIKKQAYKNVDQIHLDLKVEPGIYFIRVLYDNQNEYILKLVIAGNN